MAFPNSTIGFSEAAKYASERAAEPNRRLQKSSVFGIESVLREELADVWEECRKPDWDGYNALPVTQDALRNTYTLLESLPLGLPRPSVGAEPDGHFTLEWHHSPSRTLSVSISPDAELNYAALLGPARVCGSEPFFGEIPQSICDLVRQVNR